MKKKRTFFENIFKFKKKQWVKFSLKAYVTCTPNNLTADQRLTAESLNEGRETRWAVLFY